MVKSPFRHPLRTGFVANSVLFSMLLIVVASLAVGAVTVWALRRQVEQATDQRLADGVTLFQSMLEDTREDLTSIGAWLARDRQLRLALQEGRFDDAREAAAPAIGLQALDDLILAGPNGAVLARFRANGTAGRIETIGQQAGFQQALAGSVAHGITASSGGSLRQELFMAIYALDTRRIVGVLRLASLIDDAQLQQFRRRTGLDASLFYGGARIVTTLRDQAGEPLLDVAADPAIHAEVVGQGRSLEAWRELPIGSFRTHYLPLPGPDGAPVGMLAVALPSSTLLTELRESLRTVLPLLLLIVVGGATVAYLLARRIRDPVLALAKAATRLREGDLATPIPRVSEPELSALADELEAARSSVHLRLEAIANEEARQRALLAALNEPVLATGIDGRIVDFNPAASALFGGSARLYARPIGEVLPFVDSTPGDQPEDSVWQGQLAEASGRSVDVEVSRTRLVEGERPALDVYVVHDISRHAELNRLREQLLYSVAHELRNPISVLENALELAAAEYADLTVSEFEQLMRSARRTTARLRTLMEGLLSAGSIQSGRFHVRPRPASLPNVLDEALEAVEATIAARQQRVERQLDGEGLAVLADRRYAVQVLVNLLTNASKYSPEGEAIQVRTQRANGQVRVEVEDRGPGIPSEQRAGLFERFYRVRGRNDESGTGLGLAIVKGIVDAHGGTVGVESEVGRGTRVWFTLPAVEETRAP